MRTVFTLALFAITSLTVHATENFATWSFQEAATEWASAQPPSDQGLAKEWLQLGVATNDGKPAQYSDDGHLNDSRTGELYYLITTYKLRTEKNSKGYSTFTRTNTITKGGKTTSIPDNVAISEPTGVQTPILSGQLCGPYQECRVNDNGLLICATVLRDNNCKPQEPIGYSILTSVFE